MAEDKKLSQLIINEMTKAQYDALPTINEDEIYVITDAETAVKTDNITIVGDGTSANPIAVSSELLSKIDGEIEDRTEKDEELEQSISDLKTTVDDHIADKDNPHEVTKVHVGLSNVDNTSDVNKPVSTAQQAALDLKADKATTYTKTETDGAIETALEEYVKFTDYAGQDTAGVIKTSSGLGMAISATGYPLAVTATKSEYDSANTTYFIGKGTLENIKDDYVKRGLTENSLTFTEEEQTAARTLINAVGPSDYATSTEGGTVLVKSGYGIGHNTAAGLYTIQASEAAIDKKTNQYTPITPKVLDYAVKVGVTTNTITLTDEEKANARNWIEASSQADITAINQNISTIEGKIPATASTSNLLADRNFVTSSIQQSVASFRGSWKTYDDVPTSSSAYPVDFAGVTTPSVNDYLIVQDASDYFVSNSKNLFTPSNESFIAVSTLQEDGSYNIVPASAIGIWSNKYIPIVCEPNTVYTISIEYKTLDSALGIGFVYSDGTFSIGNRGGGDDSWHTSQCTSTVDKTVVGFAFAYNAASSSFDVKNIQVEKGSIATPYEPAGGYYLEGTWRFKYVGTWNTDGKTGWKNEYQINEKPLTDEQVDALNSGINATLVSQYNEHIDNTSNPHNVTKVQIGLSNVDNTSDMNKPISTATQTALDTITDDLSSHISNVENPHNVTKAQVGLGNVNNTSDVNKPVSTAQQAAIDAAKKVATDHIADKNNPHGVTKAQVGLGNVDNTSDLNKPISTATQTALNLKANAADVYTKTEIEENAVFYTKEQALTIEQQALARANIDSTRITDVVVYRSWSNATFLQYSKQGTKTNWTLTSETKKKLNVGDIITISATITDRGNCNAFIFAQIYDMLPNNEANVACDALLSSSNRIAPVNVSEFINDANYVNQTQLETHTNNTSNPHKVTKTQVGLGNVDNTSDLAKPISLATQEALDKKQETLTAGTNITIDGTTISAKDTTYSAGAGINIDKDGVISNTYVSGEWGKITGTLANQTDLQNALDAKANTTDIPVNVSELTNDSGYITASSDITGNAATATKLANKRTISLTGDVTGSGTFDGSANLSMSTTVVGNLHNHGVNQIKTQDESGYNWTAGSIDMITRQSIGSTRSNKSFNLPAEQIVIEYSQDGGQTWIEYPCTDEEKCGLFTETRQKIFYLGGSSDVNAKTLDWQLRVTVLSSYTKDNKTYYDRYVTVDGIYMWASTSGNKFYYKLEKALNGTPDVWAEVFIDQQLSGWSGNNIRYMQTSSWGSTAASNACGFRMTFYMKELSSGYASSTVSDIRFLGVSYYSGGNEIVKNDRLFKIDTDLNAEFPSNVKADLFEGPSTSTKAVEWQQGTANTASYVWFSDSTSTTAKGVPVWTTNFKYNPTSDTLTVGNITGNAATATNATTHIADTNVHVTTANKATWNAKQDALSGSANIDITDNVVSLTGIVPNDNLPGRLREFSNNSEAKVSSANSATKSGFWQISSGSPFTTGSSDFAVSTNAFSATYVCQIAQCYYGNQLAYRVRNSEVWTDWRLVAWADEVALKQDKLTAGEGIVISDDNEISVSLTSVPWGNITGDISQQADLMGVLSNKQNKLVAGTNMEVSGANISTTATRITIRDWSDL